MVKSIPKIYLGRIFLIVGGSFISLAATIILFFDSHLCLMYDFLKSKFLFLLVGLGFILITFFSILYYDKSFWGYLSSFFLKIKYHIISYFYYLTKYH